MADKLFTLIKSLSKQEKRYFKRSAEANRHSSNYIRLFDAINKQKSYNEADIKAVFRTEKFIKQLHVTKNYLYTLILKCLHVYHAELSADSRIKELLHYVEILYKKGLYDQCRRVLYQTRKIAKENDSHLTLIEIIEWHCKIAFNITKVKELEKYVCDEYFEETEIIKVIKNKSDFRKLFYEILILNNKGTPIRTDEELNMYEKVISNPLLRNDRLATSYYSLIMFCYIQAYYLLNKGDVEGSSVYNFRIVELMEANPKQIKETPVNYVAALNNLIYAGIHLKEYDASLNALNKMRDITVKYKISKDLSYDLTKKIFIRSSFLELELYKESGEFKKANNLISEIQERVELLQVNDISRYTLFLYYDISFIYFATNNYSKALQWINKIINISGIKEPVDIFCFARILNLLIHYELGNNQTVNYIYKSDLHFFKKRKKLYKVEILIFDFIKHTILKEASGKSLKKDFELLKNELIKNTVAPKDKKALQYFDYILWVDSKIKNLSFADIISQNKDVNTI
ncbi:MAG: hypothetical protein Q8M08_16280 [Bacteroidales bacterium]|nr:hypothetical protein [Bacteroidales bacterium]